MEIDVYKNISTALREEYQRLVESKPYKYTQAEFAHDLGIKPFTLSNYLNCHRKPSLETIYRMAETLDVSTDYLFGLTELRNRELNDTKKAIEKVSQVTGLSLGQLEKASNLKNPMVVDKTKLDSLKKAMNLVNEATRAL